MNTYDALTSLNIFEEQARCLYDKDHEIESLTWYQIHGITRHWQQAAAWIHC